jgi:hypothetical protein
MLSSCDRRRGSPAIPPRLPSRTVLAYEQHMTRTRETPLCSYIHSFVCSLDAASFVRHALAHHKLIIMGLPTADSLPKPAARCVLSPDQHIHSRRRTNHSQLSPFLPTWMAVCVHVLARHLVVRSRMVYSRINLFTALLQAKHVHARRSSSDASLFWDNPRPQHL